MTQEYDPNVGRFINADEPIYLVSAMESVGFNIFQYCENDPNQYWDPSGNSVYYYGPDQKSTALINEKRLKKKYTVYMFPMSNEKNFTNLWNVLGEDRYGKPVTMDIVIINQHGNPTGIHCINFKKLEKKKIDTLLLLSCNAGHQDHYRTNPAYKFFFNHDIRQMVCCDGTHARVEKKSYVKHYVLEDKWFKGYRPRGSKRASRGFMLYQRYEKGRVSHFSMGNYFKTIDKMLKYIGKW